MQGGATPNRLGYRYDWRTLITRVGKLELWVLELWVPERERSET